MPCLMIVDDEENVLYSFRKGLSRTGLDIATAADGAAAIQMAKARRPDAVILDVRLPDMSGLEVFDQLRKQDPRLPVIVVTAHGTTDTAIDAMKRGAFDYLVKPVDIHQLRTLTSRALEISRMQHVPAVFEDEQSGSGPADRIVGQSPAMQQVYKTIGRVAPEDVTVLILGESGTGKELAARAIYHHSCRADAPFLAINCAALPEQLLESELFGHEQGSFTGADRRRIGKFEQADGGTLFLDEVGDMSAATQAKVLRVLQDGSFERVGGSHTICTDVRVIAATNQNLEQRIDEGDFRSDLLYRLNGFSITLPALRERPDDIPLLAEHFLNLSNQQLNSQASRFSPEAIHVLRAYDWPGNVRELQSAVRYAVVHCVGDVITPDCLPDACRGIGIRGKPATDASNALPDVAAYVRQMLNAEQDDIYRHLIDLVDEVALREVLTHVAGNQVQASERLGMSRTTLRAKMNNLGLSREQLPHAAGDQREMA